VGYFSTNHMDETSGSISEDFEISIIVEPKHRYDSNSKHIL
jgi:hypothetical protein